MKYYSCPICENNDVENNCFTEGSFGTVEETISCPKCGYRYEFCYGNYLECFGKYEFHWTYSIYENLNDLHNLTRKINKAKFMSHRNWKKGLHKKFIGGLKL